MQLPAEWFALFRPAAMIFASLLITSPSTLSASLPDRDAPSRACKGHPYCGDGTVDTCRGEVCDDGNTVSGDGCSSDCFSTERCGNGIVDPAAGEECDTGGETINCDSDCTVAYCGDGKVNVTRGEDCDAAGETASCNRNCRFTVCGDGIVNAAAGEQCDTGALVGTGFCSSRCEVTCGAP